MSRISDIHNQHERTKTYIFDSIYYTNQTEFARTHMSNVCITNRSADKRNRDTGSRGQQSISKHRKSRFYLYALIKGEQR
jgi:hypothetical protein